MLKITKLLQCIKNISIKSKDCNNPTKIYFVVINKLYAFAEDINTDFITNYLKCSKQR